jgi:hypothetical protein
MNFAMFVWVKHGEDQTACFAEMADFVEIFNNSRCGAPQKLGDMAQIGGEGS